jgi:hypothetical protein
LQWQEKTNSYVPYREEKLSEQQPQSMDRQEETGHVGIDGYLQTVAGGAEYVPTNTKSSIHGNCNKVVVALPTVEQTVQNQAIPTDHYLELKNRTMLLQPLQVNTTTLEGDISNTQMIEFLIMITLLSPESSNMRGM